jgi:hypothetical protein
MATEWNNAPPPSTGDPALDAAMKAVGIEMPTGDYNLDSLRGDVSRAQGLLYDATPEGVAAKAKADADAVAAGRAQTMDAWNSYPWADAGNFGPVYAAGRYVGLTPYQTGEWMDQFISNWNAANGMQYLNNSDSVGNLGGVLLQQHGVDPNSAAYQQFQPMFNQVAAKQEAYNQHQQDLNKNHGMSTFLSLLGGAVLGPLLGPVFAGVGGVGAETALFASLGEAGSLGAAGGLTAAELGAGAAGAAGGIGEIASSLGSAWDSLGSVGQSLLKNAVMQFATTGELDPAKLGMSALGPVANMGFDAAGGWDAFTGGGGVGGDGYMDLGSWQDQGPQGDFNFATESQRYMNPTASLPTNDPYAVSGTNFSVPDATAAIEPWLSQIVTPDAPAPDGGTPAAPVNDDGETPVDPEAVPPTEGETPKGETPKGETPKGEKSLFAAVKPSQLISLSQRLLGMMGDSPEAAEAKRLMRETDAIDPKDREAIRRNVETANKLIEELMGADIEDLTAEEFSKRIEMLQSKRAKDFAKLVAALYARGQLGLSNYGEAGVDEVTGAQETYDLADGEAANPFLAARHAGLAREDAAIASSSRADVNEYLDTLLRQITSLVGPGGNDRWANLRNSAGGMFSGAQLDDAAVLEAQRRKRLDQTEVE